MNQLLKLEIEPIVQMYRRGSLDIEGEESYRNWIASKCERIPRDDFKAIVALVLQSPPRMRPSYKLFFALWKKVQEGQAEAYREKVRTEKKAEPERFTYSPAAWEMFNKELAYLKERKQAERKKDEGDDTNSIDIPFV
jgi:hypothetical protein